MKFAMNLWIARPAIAAALTSCSFVAAGPALAVGAEHEVAARAYYGPAPEALISVPDINAILALNGERKAGAEPAALDSAPLPPLQTIDVDMAKELAKEVDAARAAGEVPPATIAGVEAATPMPLAALNPEILTGAPDIEGLPTEAAAETLAIAPLPQTAPLAPADTPVALALAPSPTLDIEATPETAPAPPVTPAIAVAPVLSSVAAASPEFAPNGSTAERAIVESPSEVAAEPAQLIAIQAPLAAPPVASPSVTPVVSPAADIPAPQATPASVSPLSLTPDMAASDPTVAPPPQRVDPSKDQSGYILGTGDRLRLIVYGEKDLSGEFFIDSIGRVALPLVGEIQAAGLSLRQFESAVQALLRQGYLNDPRVSAEVLNFRPFYILGEVAKPGEYPYTSALTVYNAVATAGGFAPLANQTRVYIKSLGEPTERELRLNAGTAVQPGDTIRIVKGAFYILGEVNKPGEYPFTEGMTVVNAVASAQGFTYRANAKKVWIKHAGEPKEVQYRVTPGLTLLPGDTLRIGERFF